MNPARRINATAPTAPPTSAARVEVEVEEEEEEGEEVVLLSQFERWEEKKA